MLHNCMQTQIDSRVYANDFMYPILLKDVFDECFGICSGIDPCSSGKTRALLRYFQGSYQIIIGYDEGSVMEMTIVEK